MRQKQISRVSIATMVGLVIFLVYYPYCVLIEIIPFAFTKPELWQEHWMVQTDVMIPFSMRLSYFALWLFPVLATVVMTIVALHLLNLIRKGVYFDPRTVRDVQILGLSASVAGVAVTLGYSLSPWLVTMMNVENRRGIHFGYDPSEIGLIMMGLGLFLAGWILKVVVLQDQENKGFI